MIIERIKAAIRAAKMSNAEPLEIYLTVEDRHDLAYALKDTDHFVSRSLLFDLEGESMRVIFDKPVVFGLTVRDGKASYVFAITREGGTRVPV